VGEQGLNWMCAYMIYVAYTLRQRSTRPSLESKHFPYMVECTCRHDSTMPETPHDSILEVLFEKCNQCLSFIATTFCFIQVLEMDPAFRIRLQVFILKNVHFIEACCQQHYKLLNILRRHNI